MICQGHTVEWESQDLNPDLSGSKAEALTHDLTISQKLSDGGSFCMALEGQKTSRWENCLADPRLAHGMVGSQEGAKKFSGP